MTTSPSVSWHRNWLFPLFLLLVTFPAYQPAWHGEYIWDDPKWVSEQPGAHSWQGLEQIWFHPAQQFYPLTYTLCWLEYYLWGNNPTGYHLVNILFHVSNAVLLWILLRRLSVPGAWLAAAIFALHPVNVESAVWISEQKNTLSCFFFLYSLLAALKFWMPELAQPPASAARHPSSALRPPQFYWLAFVFFLCALLSKTAALPLPAVILLLVWWKRGRLAWRDIFPSFLFFAVGVALGFATLQIEHHIGARGKEFDIPLVVRCLIAGRAVWFYLGKLVWPHPLIMIYPRWQISPSSVTAWLCLLAVPAILAVLWLKRNTWGRPLFVAFAYFLGMLFLTLGFFNIFFFRYSFVSDHFQYFACLGPIALFAAGATLAVSRLGKAGAFLAPLLSACLLAVLGTLTWKQCETFANAETLWRTTVNRNPYAYAAYINLGDIFMNKGQVDAAIEKYQKALALHPESFTYDDLGLALLRQGKTDAAYSAFEKALQLQPDHASDDYAIALCGVGDMHLDKGEIVAAIQSYQKALQVEPALPIVWLSLGSAYVRQGDFAHAEHAYQKALQYTSLDVDKMHIYNNLGHVFMSEGRVNDAISAFQDSLGLSAAQPEIQVELGKCLLQAQQPEQAAVAFQNALNLQPNDADADAGLGMVSETVGSDSDAVMYYRNALLAAPDSVIALNNLAWLLATDSNPALRNGSEAVSLAKSACDLTHYQQVRLIGTLAAAYAEAGRFEDAIATAQKAIALAQQNGETDLVDRNKQLLQSYVSHQAYHEPAVHPRE